ncbi:hypothetical protein V2J09_020449 [Rumex salicifolius]
MVWCSNCTRIQPAQSVRSSLICCHGCGKVVNQQTGSKKRSISEVAAEQTTVSKKAIGATSSYDDSESLSDIDDAEVRSYLLKEDEVLFKKMMWERSNLEYTKAETARKATAANAMKLKKEKQRMKAAGTKNSWDTVKTAVKRTSSRVNYDALKELLGESEASEKTKKSLTESHSEDDAVSNNNESGQNKLSDRGTKDDDYDEENDMKCQNDLYDDYEEEQDYDDDLY